jgi:hypothetical protein
MLDPNGNGSRTLDLLHDHATDQGPQSGHGRHGGAAQNLRPLPGAGAALFDPGFHFPRPVAQSPEGGIKLGFFEGHGSVMSC